ncbi:MAG TPA: alpha/beta hydrolase [Nitrososphaerales archaeon]|nr:alpha/beta hydrolase [Nitrososphaerales archaeon]
MPPSPKALEYVDRQNANNIKDISELEPVDARAEDFRATMLFLGKSEPVEKIENHVIHEGLAEIAIRVYWPKISNEEKDEQDLYPIIVYFHGGGWVLGNLDSTEELCCMLSNHSESIVISVDYRLAPEHKFPRPLHDCYAATKWAYDNAKFLEGDQDTIIVAGSSAGGNLAAAVALMAKEKKGPPIAAQLLIYPITDMTSDLSKYSKDQFGPSKEAMDWFGMHYVKNDSEFRNPLVSPIFGNLNELPQAIMVTAELDPLRDQDLRYLNKLQQTGVKTLLLDYPSTVHGFMDLPSFFPEGREAIEKISGEIKKIYVENVM